MTSSEREYRPGFRPGRKKYGQVSNNQAAWLETHYGVINMMLYPWREEDELSSLNVGPNVSIVMPPRQNNMMLTNLTVEELHKMKEFFDLAFELALPVAAERDRIADESAGNGDDSVYRAYRRAPSLVIREGQITAHREGIQFGSVGVSGSNGDSNSDGGRVRGASACVAADGQEERSSLDDATPPDESEDVV